MFSLRSVGLLHAAVFWMLPNCATNCNVLRCVVSRSIVCAILYPSSPKYNDLPTDKSPQLLPNWPPSILQESVISGFSSNLSIMPIGF
uniref:U18-Liphistoxin-Lsp1a_1 n=1 Tax=Liphistius sp. SGP-2016 TaxID=1905180 RepID=A0A4Q8K523_9ARAC